MNIEYITEDKSLKYRLEYIVGRKLRGIRGDKTHPPVTQCLLYRNGLLLGFGEVVKCEGDVHNIEFARKLATKKVMQLIPFRDVRTKIWEQINTKYKPLNIE